MHAVIRINSCHSPFSEVKHLSQRLSKFQEILQLQGVDRGMDVPAPIFYSIQASLSLFGDLPPLLGVSQDGPCLDLSGIAMSALTVLRSFPHA